MIAKGVGNATALGARVRVDGAKATAALCKECEVAGVGEGVESPTQVPTHQILWACCGERRRHNYAAPMFWIAGGGGHASDTYQSQGLYVRDH